MRLLLNWLLSAIALIIVSYVVPGFHVEGFKEALIAAVVIGLINATLGMLLKLVTLPLTLITLGVFWWVVNALMLMLASTKPRSGSQRRPPSMRWAWDRWWPFARISRLPGAA